MKLAIIGHARSGTTVLQNAINASADAYLLGEAKLYCDGGGAGFRRRYNEMHRNYGNQYSKSTYAPVLPGLDPDADGGDYLEELAQHYRVVGDKLALGHPRFGHDLDKVKAWLETTRSACLFLFRRPASVIVSAQSMFGDQIALPWHVASYALTASLYLDVLRVMPQVRCLIHERLTQRSFSELGRWLGIDLSGAFELYDRASAKVPGLPSEVAAHAADLERLYDGIVALATARRPDPRLQLEQKIAPIGRSIAVGELWRLAIAIAERADEQAAALERGIATANTD